MFAITADQIGSRERGDAAGDTRDRINSTFASELVLPADRNAGDEIQMLSASASATLEIILELSRDRQWSVGLGCGTVRTPLPAATREASGLAFFAARDAVNAAKKRRTHVAVRAHALDNRADTSAAAAGDIEAILDLLLIIRERRTAPGWELYDLVATGLTQQDAAERLRISAPAASSRAHAANIKAEAAALPALTKLLNDLDATTEETDPRA